MEYFQVKHFYVVVSEHTSLFVESTQMPLDTICKDLLAKKYLHNPRPTYFLTTSCYSNIIQHNIGLLVINGHRMILDKVLDLLIFSMMSIFLDC